MGIPVNPMFYRKSNIPPELEKSNLYQTLSRHIGSPVDWAKGNIKSINRIKKWLGKYVDIPGHPIGHIDDIQKALYQYGPTRMRSYPSYIDAVSTDEMMEALRNTNPELYQKYVDEPDASSELIKLLKQVPGDVVGPNHSIYDVSLEWPGAKELIDPLAREHFYQWDLPFSKQPEEIQKILSSVKSERPDILPKLSGISQLFKDTVSTPYENSLERELYRRGVPGTAYYDAYSRKRGMSDAERKFNYVIWGDEIPNIKAHNNPSTLEKMWPKRKR
jgi:hypothetical protein